MSLKGNQDVSDQTGTIDIYQHAGEESLATASLEEMLTKADARNAEKDARILVLEAQLAQLTEESFHRNVQLQGRIHELRAQLTRASAEHMAVERAAADQKINPETDDLERQLEEMKMKLALSHSLERDERAWDNLNRALEQAQIQLEKAQMQLGLARSQCDAQMQEREAHVWDDRASAAGMHTQVGRDRALSAMSDPVSQNDEGLYDGHACWAPFEEPEQLARTELGPQVVSCSDMAGANWDGRCHKNEDRIRDLKAHNPTKLCEEFHAELIKLADENCQLWDKMRSLELQHGEALSVAEVLRAKLRQSQEEATRLESEAAEWKRRCGESEAIAITSLDDEKRYREEIEVMRAEIEHWKDAAHRLTAGVSAWKQKCNESDAAVAEGMVREEHRRQEVQGLEDRLLALRSYEQSRDQEVQELNDQLAARETDEERRDRETQEVNAYRDTLEVLVRHLGAQVETYQGRERVHQEAEEVLRRGFQEEVQELRTARDALEAEAERLRGQVETYYGREQVYREAEAELRREMTRLRQEVVDWKEKWQESQSAVAARDAFTWRELEGEREPDEP